MQADEIFGIVETIDPQFMRRVGRGKADHNLGLADAFAAATAEENGYALITTDRNDFAEVEQVRALQIIWLR